MNTINIVLVALYRYQNFPIRIMHSLLEKIKGVNVHTIFLKQCETNLFELPTKVEEELFIKRIVEIDPEVVGISVLSPFVPIARKLTKLIKDNSRALVIWGGIHPTISPETCIKDADMICIGEGEGAIVDLVASLKAGNENLHIRNLWFKKNDNIIRNSLRPLIQNLDSLPFPSYGSDSFYFIDSNKLSKDDPVLFDSVLLIQISRRYFLPVHFV